MSAWRDHARGHDLGADASVNSCASDRGIAPDVNTLAQLPPAERPSNRNEVSRAMADVTRASNSLDRREFPTAAALASASAMVLGPHAAAAAAERYPAVRKAAEAGRDADIKRIQDWIALPSIAAENLNMKEGAAFMANLAREAGFDSATIVPTDGHPGVFATMDNGADRTLALYFMYDVKQFDPAEWTSPPLEGFRCTDLLG